GQVAKCWVQRVADPPAAMQQLKGKVILVPFADGPQHTGQPVAQSSEPAEPVEPSRQIVMPTDPPGRRERGTDSRLGLLAGCRRIVGLAAACSHQVPPWWRQLVARSWKESSRSSLIPLVSPCCTCARPQTILSGRRWYTSLTAGCHRKLDEAKTRRSASAPMP